MNIKSFYLSYILTKRSGKLPEFYNYFLPRKLKQKFFQNKLLDNCSLKKCKYEKLKKYNETAKTTTFHQICSHRYHRHIYSKKKVKWTYGLVQYRIDIQQPRPQSMFCYKRKMINRPWNSWNTLLKFAQIKGLLFGIDYRRPWNY